MAEPRNFSKALKGLTPEQKQRISQMAPEARNAYITRLKQKGAAAAGGARPRVHDDSQRPAKSRASVHGVSQSTDSLSSHGGIDLATCMADPILTGAYLDYLQKAFCPESLFAYRAIIVLELKFDSLTPKERYR